MDTVNVRTILEENGIKPSLHRMKILDYLLENLNHPTVDMIFKDISDDIPTLSKTTIYNTLQIFLEKGVVQAITIEENEVKFDPTITPHAHLKCNQCENLFDIELDNTVFELAEIDSHQIESCQIYFMGTCKFCS